MKIHDVTLGYNDCCPSESLFPIQHIKDKFNYHVRVMFQVISPWLMFALLPNVFPEILRVLFCTLWPIYV